jgi:MoaA/NifB/PqqE/SkfB family radical SAM enzyme
MTQVNEKIFCSSPWYELQIYWDGSFGCCCQEDHKVYTEGDYNIATMTINEWFNSAPMQKFRQDILGHQAVSACKRCYVQERHNANSRRLRVNQKSVIFTQAFHESFEQSPGRKHFQPSGIADTHPIDLHLDLGNYCNLACKMCGPHASSTIASQHVRWGIESDRKYLGSDWTADPAVWRSFKQQLFDIPGLNNIHLMGGETFLTDKFEDVLDTAIQHRRFDLCFSFVTNGTVFKPRIIEKLTQFRRVGIEVSIETADKHNSYQRQGTDTDLVLYNIDQYLEFCNNTSITVSLRPTITAFNIGYYWTLLEYALQKRLIIKSNICTWPHFVVIDVLPKEVKQQYLETYEQKFRVDHSKLQHDFNASNPNHAGEIINIQVAAMKKLLQNPEPSNIQQLQAELVAHCKKWDSVYGYNARELYPELESMWNKHGY